MTSIVILRGDISRGAAGEIIRDPLARQRIKNTLESQFAPDDYKSSEQQQVFPHQKTSQLFLFCSAAL